MPVIESIIKEGALTFTFPADSMASKYDDWSHYRNQFQSVCGGSKGVDIVYAEGGVAWLIEVKDYRQHARTKAMELPEEIAIKVRDTVAGLVSAKCTANNADEKRCAHALIRANTIRVVCHLEQPEKRSRLHPRGAIAPSDLQQKLKMLIKAIDPHPSVVDMRSLHPSMTWRVA